MNIQKDRKMKKVLFLSGILLAFSVNAYATGTRYYVAEPQYYTAKAKTYHTTGARPYIGLDYVNSSIGIDDKGGLKWEQNLNAFALSVGARINKHFGFEGFYQQSEEGEKTTSGIIKTTDEYKAYGVDFIAYTPITNNLEALLSCGIANYEIEAAAKLFGVNAVEGDDDGIGYRMGIGFQYNFDEHWAARLMGRYAATDIDDVDHIIDITAGVRYLF